MIKLGDTPEPVEIKAETEVAAFEAGEAKAAPVEAPVTQESIQVGLSAATGKIKGIDALVEAANKGDLVSARLVQDIARDALAHLTSGIPSVIIDYSPTTGLYGGFLEPSLGLTMTFDSADRKDALAALVKFSENFKQEQFHVREDAEIGTVEGHVYEDGTHNSYSHKIYLNGELSRSEIESIAKKSKLVGFTAGKDYLETYYVGKVDDEKAIEKFESGVRTAKKLLAGFTSKVESRIQRLGIYGNDGIPYGQVAGVVSPKATEQA